MKFNTLFIMLLIVCSAISVTAMAATTHKHTSTHKQHKAKVSVVK